MKRPARSAMGMREHGCKKRHNEGQCINNKFLINISVIERVIKVNSKNANTTEPRTVTPE